MIMFLIVHKKKNRNKCSKKQEKKQKTWYLDSSPTLVIYDCRWLASGVPLRRQSQRKRRDQLDTTLRSTEERDLQRFWTGQKVCVHDKEYIEKQIMVYKSPESSNTNWKIVENQDVATVWATVLSTLFWKGFFPALCDYVKSP